MKEIKETILNERGMHVHHVRVTVCWNCHHPINNLDDTECDECGWIICPVCGSCAQDCHYGHPGGFSSEGIHRNGTHYDDNGFDSHGFGKDGYSKDGFDKYGYDREGRDRFGFDDDGFDKDGYDRDGFNTKGYDRYGFDRKGFNVNGFDRDGYGRDGFSTQGYNKYGFDRDGNHAFLGKRIDYPGLGIKGTIVRCGKGPNPKVDIKSDAGKTVPNMDICYCLEKGIVKLI